MGGEDGEHANAESGGAADHHLRPINSTIWHWRESLFTDYFVPRRVGLFTTPYSPVSAFSFAPDSSCISTFRSDIGMSENPP